MSWGGYGLNDGAYYVGASKTFSDGDKREYGQRGTVVGPATVESHKGKGVKVQFPGNKGAVDCYFVSAAGSFAESVFRRQARVGDHVHVRGQSYVV